MEEIMKEENFKVVQEIMGKIEVLRREVSELSLKMPIRIKVAVPQRDSNYHPIMTIAEEMQEIVRTMAINSREKAIAELTKELEAL
jgi:hypothetical protein